MDNNTDMVQGLYGSQVSKSKVVGYCKHHCAALTAKTLKNHECLKKNCNALKKYEEHDYWKEREALKQRKKQNKMNREVC